MQFRQQKQRLSRKQKRSRQQRRSRRLLRGGIDPTPPPPPPPPPKITSFINESARSDEKQSLGKKGSLCSGLPENECMKAKLACQWYDELSKHGRVIQSAHCQRRGYGTQANIDELNLLDTKRDERLKEMIIEDKLIKGQYKKLGSRCTGLKGPDCKPPCKLRSNGVCAAPPGANLER